MKNAGLLSLTDSTPLVMLNVEQVREIIRQEFLLVFGSTNRNGNETKLTRENELATKPYLTVKEAAQILTLGVSTVRLYLSRGQLGHSRKGRKLIIPRSEIEKFMAEESK